MTLRERVQVAPGVPGYLHVTLPVSMGAYLLCILGALAEGRAVHLGAPDVFAAVFWIGYVIWHEAERARLLRLFWRRMDEVAWEDIAREHGWDPERLVQRGVVTFNQVWGREILRLTPEEE